MAAVAVAAGHQRSLAGFSRNTNANPVNRGLIEKQHPAQTDSKQPQSGKAEHKPNQKCGNNREQKLYQSNLR
jgi:hypothetical protein